MKREHFRFYVGDTLILVRRATSEEWRAHNPVLRTEELAYDMDAQSFKIGDGRTPWNDLPWYLVPALGVPTTYRK